VVVPRPPPVVRGDAVRRRGVDRRGARGAREALRVRGLVQLMGSVHPGIAVHGGHVVGEPGCGSARRRTWRTASRWRWCMWWAPRRALDRRTGEQASGEPFVHIVARWRSWCTANWRRGAGERHHALGDRRTRRAGCRRRSDAPTCRDSGRSGTGRNARSSRWYTSAGPCRTRRAYTRSSYRGEVVSGILALRAHGVVAFVHVRLLTQLGTGGARTADVRGDGVVEEVSGRARGARRESVAVWQVSAEVQWSTGVH
jgi:hypothetical protein